MANQRIRQTFPGKCSKNVSIPSDRTTEPYPKSVAKNHGFKYERNHRTVNFQEFGGSV
jgi:hypothetical protein